jgi:hypothetical protein
MPIEADYKDFKFKSSLGATLIVMKGFGLMIAWISFDFLDLWWLHPTWDQFLRFISGLPIGLPLLVLGAVLVLNSCQIEVVDGQFRFRRFIAWESVPLESVTSVRRTFVGTYIKIDHGGKCYRLFFHPKGEDMHWLARSPVVGFLQELCKKNKERRSP